MHDTDREPLTTGWEPALAVDDTLMRQVLFHLVDQLAAIAVAGGGRALATPGWAAADLGRPATYWNGAVLLQPPPQWDDVVDEIEGFFAGGPGGAVLWSAWPTPDLRARGWSLVGHPPVLLRPPDRMAPVADAPGDRTVDVRPVHDAADLAAWEQVAVEGYPMPAAEPLVPGALLAPAILHDARYRFWLGRIDGRPVSASASFTGRGVASLAFGATRPEARGRGHWHRHAVERLRTHPTLWTAGVFSDMSRPLAQRLGFVPIQRLTLWAAPSAH